jgi:serine/threonine-protein kinase
MDAQGQAMETDQAQIDSGHDTASASDSFISRVAVDAKLATPDEIRRCKSKQEEFKSQGKEYKLSSIMVKAGVITASQLRRLMNPADSSVSQSLQQIPGFQILQKIGAGAMASVYKARQLSLDRIVAIKILPKRLSEDPEFVERFYKEGQAAAKLNHNNIVQAIDVGEHGGYHYFVMEYVDGETVYDELVKNRIYPEERALDLITQIAKALEHAHAKGLIHRDVKPKNIMITKGGTAKLADMGLARQADDAAVAEAEKGRAFGTPYYISPEQIRGVLDVDFRADIYSLGGTLYHMLTGRVPFDGPSPTAIMQKHLKQQLIPPDHVNKSLSTGTAEVVEHMMAKDRDLRYHSTTDLLVDLTRIQRGEAPLQARSGYDNELLANLADGSGDGFSQMDGSGAGSRDAARDASGGEPNGWMIAVVFESMAIVVLLLLLIFGR